MARGRPPKPREQRIAEGNPSRRPLPEPVLGLGKVLTFDPPDDLRPAEAEVWAAHRARIRRARVGRSI
jgi:hypothetical protein